MTLAELIEKLSTVRVVIGGQVFTARVLSAEEQIRLERVFPMPRPPMVKDPKRGSLAPLVPDEDDPEYIRGLEDQTLNLMAARVAVGLGDQLGCGGADLLGDPAAMREAAEKIKRLPYAVLRRVSESIRTGAELDERGAPVAAETGGGGPLAEAEKN